MAFNRKQLNGVMQARIADANTMTVTIAVRVDKQLVPVIGMNLKRRRDPRSAPSHYEVRAGSLASANTYRISEYCLRLWRAGSGERRGVDAWRLKARAAISSRWWRCWRPASSRCRSSSGSASARCSATCRRPGDRAVRARAVHRPAGDPACRRARRRDVPVRHRPGDAAVAAVEPAARDLRAGRRASRASAARCSPAPASLAATRRWSRSSPAWASCCPRRPSSCRSSSERGDTSTPRGQRIMSILLLEDLAIVPLLAIVAFLAPGAAEADAQSRWLAIGIALAAVAGADRRRPLAAQPAVPRCSPPPRRAR